MKLRHLICLLRGGSRRAEGWLLWLFHRRAQGTRWLPSYQLLLVRNRMSFHHPWRPFPQKLMKFRRSLSGPVLHDTARLSQRYPPIARYGVFGVSTWPIGCNTPSPFSERFPFGEHANWRCDAPPPQRGISAIPARYPMKTRQMGAIPPSAILSRKGIARYGGVSRTGPLRAFLLKSWGFPP